MTKRNLPCNYTGILLSLRHSSFSTHILVTRGSKYALTVLKTADTSQLSKNIGKGKQETPFPLEFFCSRILYPTGKTQWGGTTYLIVLLQCMGKGNSDFNELQTGQTQPHTHGECLSKQQTSDIGLDLDYLKTPPRSQHKSCK